MHYFVFKNSRYSYKTSSLNVSLIHQLSPDAKVHDSTINESCYIQNIFNLVDSTHDYSVIEVSNDDQATLLLASKDLLINTTVWYAPKLQYVLKDVKTERLDKDAVHLKLIGNSADTEDPDVASKAYGLKQLNRKFIDFKHRVDAYHQHISADLYKTITNVQLALVNEVDEFRDQRKKAKADANKAKNSLKAKLLRFAIYKAGR